MIDKYAGFANISSQAERWHTLGALSDIADLAERPKALRFNSAGNVTLEGTDGIAVTFVVAAGEVLDVRPTRIHATGTTMTADQIILYLD